jgi:hypothetical protein
VRVVPPSGVVRRVSCRSWGVGVVFENWTVERVTIVARIFACPPVCVWCVWGVGVVLVCDVRVSEVW